MSFPPPIIPQTAEQAIARDQIAGLDAVRLDDPRAELERLRQAIREHHEASAPSRNDADCALWAHVGLRGTA